MNFSAEDSKVQAPDLETELKKEPRFSLPGPDSLLTKIVFWVLLLLCLSPWMPPPVALLLGLLIAQTIGHPHAAYNQKATNWLLKISVVGLGFGMNATAALKAGSEGFVFTVASITGVLVLGFLLGRLLKINRKASHLIASGTAICGGSAIAAVAPVIRAEESQITVALGTVFIFNSIALLVFPAIGHHFHMSQSQFGLWCAIAIHDTSSVVGAAAAYGKEALGIATTVKLARALWIIPVSLLSAALFKTKGARIKIPWFIGLFIVTIILNTYVPFIQRLSSSIVTASRAGLTATLFLIGCGLSRKMWKAVGPRPLLQGVILWVVISIATLAAILHFAG